MTFSVLLRGPLGAGKTTVARALATAVHGRVISIDELLDTLPWDGGSEVLFLSTNDLVVPIARSSLAEGTSVVIDGNFYWASAIADLQRRLPAPVLCITLVVPLVVCIERDRDRPAPHGAIAAREVFEKVDRVRATDPVDGTRPVPEIVAAIRRRLATGAGERGPRPGTPG